MTALDIPAKDIYCCRHCAALNDAALSEWCLCTGGEQTPVCSRCGRCFCDAPTAWKVDFWRYASAGLIARRREERRSRGMFVAPRQAPVRPVILLIDDDRLVHSIVERVLRGAGFAGTLVHAFDGADGLRTAQRIVPDLVLADALLPMLDGRAVTRTLRSEAPTAHLKVVVMTALYKGARYRNEALTDFGADEFLEKPVSAATLRTVIAALIGPVFAAAPGKPVEAA